MPNFDFIEDIDFRKSSELAYIAISELYLWNWLKLYNPPDNCFLFNLHQNLIEIEDKLFQNGDIHSGASFSIVMQNMKYIAIYGFENWKEYNMQNLIYPKIINNI
jgi:hypothetical protein